MLTLHKISLEACPTILYRTNGTIMSSILEFRVDGHRFQEAGHPC